MVDAVETDAASSGEDESRELGFLPVLVSTFTTVFLAELGDKTQLATLLLSAQSGQPWLVFAAAALALISSSLVGVLVGRWLARILPAERLERMAGILMVGLGLWLGLQATQSLLISTQQG
ncbi:MAG: TMEM165/GDT1 family protein [Prochlorococcus sp.]|nr:TMEM165/GDT1 family protein [Prochlorococcaceae cyanobacterium Fu_MAG_50]